MSDTQELEEKARQIEGAIAVELEALAELMAHPPAQSAPAAMKQRLVAAKRLISKLRKTSNAAQKIVASGRKTQSQRRRDIYFQGLRHRLRKWNRVQVTYDQAIAQTPTPLTVGDTPAHFAQQLEVIDHVYTAIYGLLRADTQDDRAALLGYPDIPLTLSRFSACCHAALRLCLAQQKPRPLRFLDVGCGVGITLLSAARVFDRATGLEFDPGYVATARNLHIAVGSDRVEVTAGDAMDFDVIYFFKPIQSREKMRALEHRIIAQARPGTVLIAPYMDFATDNPHQPCHSIVRYVHVVGLTESQANALGQEAQMIGPAIIPPDQDKDPKAGFLAPLIDALAQRGFALKEDRPQI